MGTEEKAEELKALRQELGVVELNVLGNFTLADAIREGSQVSNQEFGWGNGAKACALHAAIISAKSRNYL